MDEARRLVAASRVWAERSIFVVRAGHQYAGRGRRGARWHDRPGEAILATIVLRHDASVARYDSTIPLRVGLGVCRGVEAVLPASVPLIKWPNDILVDDRKLAGILVESDAERAYIGIGINRSAVREPVEGLPPVSLGELIPGTEPPPADVVWSEVLREVQQTLPEEGWREAVLRHLAWRDRDVEIQGRAGRIVGIDHDGALQLRVETGPEEAGTVVRVVSGTLRIASPTVRSGTRRSSSRAAPPAPKDDEAAPDHESHG